MILRSASPADGGRLNEPTEAVAAPGAPIVSLPLLVTRGNEGILLRRALG